MTEKSRTTPGSPAGIEPPASMKPPGGSTVGVLVRGGRQRASLSLAELAVRCGCGKGYLSEVENDLRVPTDEVLQRIAESLGLQAGPLLAAAAWQRSIEAGGEVVREHLQASARRDEAAKRLAGVLRSGSLDAAHRTGELARLVHALNPEGVSEASVQPVALPLEVPLINKVAAGYPREFTDLAYPARVADEYVRCPDVSDPDAFAARVVGDSMEPEYREGDVVVFSPARAVRNGMDVFARLEPDHETTFKRVYFEGESGSERIRLQPLNSKYPPRVVEREQVAGLYAAVTVMRRIGSA